MSENSESPTQPISNSPSAANSPVPSNKKVSSGRKSGSSKPVFGKTAFRLPIALDRALRLASVLLEEAGDEIHTPQQMVEHALRLYVEHLQKKRGLDFQGIITPKPASPTKPS